jgi:hypothetical protein
MGRSATYVSCLAVLLALTTGCGDGAGPDPVIPALLVGNWVAEPACLPHCGFTLTSVASPSDSVNATAFVGMTTEIGIRADGRFTLAFYPGGGTPLPGTAHVAGSMLIVRDAAGVVDTMDYVVTTSTLDLRFRRVFTSFDFTGDGTPDPARARGVFVKR